jgi:hypothetical protein
MIYPCQTPVNGSPSHCHCVGCNRQVERATSTVMAIKSTQPQQQHGDMATPLIQKVSLFDRKISSELKRGTATSPHQRPGTYAITSRTRPIHITMEERAHRRREVQDQNQSETYYSNATWRMYHRITKYRVDHPVPDCYYHSITSTTKGTTMTNLNTDTVGAVRTHSNGTTSMTSGRYDVQETRTTGTDNIDLDENDFVNELNDEHSMMFELDMS